MRYREYKNGVRLSGSFVNVVGSNLAKRSNIGIFSSASQERLSWVYFQGPWESMITLTYHNDFPNRKESKRQMNVVLQYLRRKNVKYLWVLEFQKRGVPHYHVWLNKKYDDCALSIDLPGENSWRGIMKTWLKASNQINDKEAVDFHLHQKSYTDWVVNLKCNYAKKYASKKEQKGLPVGVDRYGRWWGSSNNLNLEIIDIKTKELENSDDNRDTILGWNRFRRQTKKYIEKKFKMKFPKDKVGANLAIRWTMQNSDVKNIYRLSMCYLVNYSVMSIDGKRKMF
jgi:hypothetical protein